MKKIITLAIILTLAVASLITGITVGATNAKDTTAGNGGSNKAAVVNNLSSIVWKGESDKAAAVNIIEVKNDTRKNASGVKITSNAHSADFPGIYFIWDSKQKDNGYLKVDGSVFDKYQSFVLTSKESNTYWDFKIELTNGQSMTEDGCYVFFIPKVYNNKNINMVFISEFTEKYVEPIIERFVTPIYSGDEAFMGNAYVNIENYASVWDSAWNITENFVADGNQAIPVWYQPVADPNVGDLHIFSLKYFIEGTITGGTDLKIACDNGFILLINGNFIASSDNIADKVDAILNGEEVDLYNPEDWVDSWKTVYTVAWEDIQDFFVSGENLIQIVAYNTPDHDAFGKFIHDGTPESNPAGLIFACVVYSEKTY